MATTSAFIAPARALPAVERDITGGNAGHAIRHAAH
jgi:hypothetical protein